MLKKFNEFKKEEVKSVNEENNYPGSKYWEDINDKKGTNYTDSVLDYLTYAYQLWCDANNLPQRSADEFEEGELNEDQQKYVSAFIDFWDKTQEFEGQMYNNGYQTIEE